MERSMLGSWLFLQDIFFNNDSSSSSSDEEEVHNMLITKIKNREKDYSRIPNYFELIVPTYTDCQFQSHFRMTRASFNRLMGIIGHKLIKKFGRGREQIDCEKQVLSVIWLLSTPESYRYVMYLHV